MTTQELLARARQARGAMALADTQTKDRALRAMAEELEADEFAPMFEACLPQLRDKPIALFGYYGWGDGEWMRSWEGSCVQGGAILAAASVICQEAPDEEADAACKALGRALAGS